MGSTNKPSSFKYVKTLSSVDGNIDRVILFNCVKIYLSDALSLPPCSLVPNCPFGRSKLILFEPTKFCAIPTIAPFKLASPWWYPECSETYPENCATLISVVRFFLKAENRIFLKLILSPSIKLGILLSQSYFEKWISSRLINSSYETFVFAVSRYASLSYNLSQSLRSSALFLLKTISIASSLFSECWKPTTFLFSKYSRNSFPVLVPSPL